MNAYSIITKLLLLAATLQLGLNLSHIEKCNSRMCMDEIQHASLKVLRIDWKPISVFPDKVINRNRR